jgi:plastocyanin
MMAQSLLPLFSFALLLGACGDSHANHGADAAVDHAGHSTDTVTADQAVVTDGPATRDGAAIPMLNDCTPGEYIERIAADAERVIRPRGNTGYDPRCVVVRMGQSVTFEMNFSVHPLTAGIPHGPTAGAAMPNPIGMATSGMTHVVSFAAQGFYPFYCTVHGHVGMAGVVRVVP